MARSRCTHLPLSLYVFLSTMQLIDDSAAVKATALWEKGTRGRVAALLAACCISAVVAINSEIGQRQLERRRMLQAFLPARPGGRFNCLEN